MSTIHTTVSKVLSSGICKDERELLLKWCELCAQAGGSFGIETIYSANWYHVYTINWPSRKFADELAGGHQKGGEV